MSKPRPFYLGGEFISSDETLAVHDPYDGSEVGVACLAGSKAVEAAIKTAGRAFRKYRRQPAYERAALLARIRDGVAGRREVLASLLAREAGKPITQARAEVERCLFTFTDGVEEAKRLGGEFLPLDRMPAGVGRWGVVARVPLGVVSAITPFNFPLNLVAHKIAPALAAGNAIVCKPAPQTPLIALALAEIIHEAGCPPGLVNVLPAPVEAAGALVTDTRIQCLTFTGSQAVGWELQRTAGKKRVLLELGGNAACIVHSDTDLKAAAARCAAGGFGYAGQSCIAVQRILVHAPVYEKFLSALVRRARALPVGNPLDEGTAVGPLHAPKAAKRVMGWIAEAMGQGATLACGGERIGNCVLPTVLTGTTPGMQVNREEVFGPVVTVTPYEEFREALKMANRSPYGLQAGVFTRDLGRIRQAFDALEVGGVIVEDVPTWRVDHMPYGGVKDSGRGREGVRYAVEEMTERRLLVLPDLGASGS